MNPNKSFEKVIICLTIVFLFIISYNKIINILNVKTTEISDTTHLDFTKISDNTNSISVATVTKNTNKENNQISSDQNITCVNINTATLDQLTKINGIGEVMAQRIIDFRTQNGNFKRLEELMLS